MHSPFFEDLPKFVGTLASLSPQLQLSRTLEAAIQMGRLVMHALYRVNNSALRGKNPCRRSCRPKKGKAYQVTSHAKLYEPTLTSIHKLTITAQHIVDDTAQVMFVKDELYG